MSHPKSLDLRRSALQAYKRGEGTLKQIARLFNVSTASLVRWRALEQAGEDLAALPHSGGRVHQKIFEQHRVAIAQWVEDTPDLTLREIAAQLLEQFEVSIDPSWLSQILKQMKLPLKKRHSSTLVSNVVTCGEDVGHTKNS